MNAGAYGGEMKDVLRSCEHMTPEGELVTLKGEELALSYRHSAYSGGKNVILFLHMEPVSYTHLDVYKRQVYQLSGGIPAPCF